MKDRQKSVEQQIAERELLIQQEMERLLERDLQSGILEQAQLGELLRLAQEDPKNIEAIQKITNMMNNDLLDESLDSLVKRMRGSEVEVGRIRKKMERRLFIWKEYPSISVEGVQEGKIWLSKNKSQLEEIRGYQWDNYLSFTMQGEDIVINLMNPNWGVDGTQDTFIRNYSSIKEFHSVEELMEAVVEVSLTSKSGNLNGFGSLKIKE